MTTLRCCHLLFFCFVGAAGKPSPAGVPGGGRPGGGSTAGALRALKHPDLQLQASLQPFKAAEGAGVSLCPRFLMCRRARRRPCHRPSSWALDVGPRAPYVSLSKWLPPGSTLTQREPRGLARQGLRPCAC